MRDTASTTSRISLLAIALTFAQGAGAADIAPSALSPRTEMKAVAPGSTFAPNSPVVPAHPVPGAASTKPNDSPNSRNAHAVNASVFSADDRAIIIVGGKQVTAGDVKREFKAELARKSGPAKTVRVAARKQAAVSMPTVATSANVRSGMAPRSTIESAGFAPSAVNQRAHSPSALDPSTKVVALPDTINPNRDVFTIIDCKKRVPEITQLRGSVASGQKFMIYGNCLGAQTGAIEIIGQFPNGNVRVAFDKWAEDSIEVVMPAVRGAADHVVAITVVRNGDNARSPAKQANFHAARERVEVPAVDWNPDASFINIGVDEGGGNIFGGYKVFGSGAGSYSANFRVAVPTACYLDNMEAQSQTGSVQQINGWENGPPNVANVQIVWSPVCTTTTTNYVIASSSQRVCSVAFNLKAWAQCPVGIAP